MDDRNQDVHWVAVLPLSPYFLFRAVPGRSHMGFCKASNCKCRVIKNSLLSNLVTAVNKSSHGAWPRSHRESSTRLSDESLHHSWARRTGRPQVRQ